MLLIANCPRNSKFGIENFIDQAAFKDTAQNIFYLRGRARSQIPVYGLTGHDLDSRLAAPGGGFCKILE